MRTSAGNLFLRLAGGLLGVVGFLAWIGVAWRAVADVESVTPQGEEGGRLMVWAVTGTVLMIGGTILLHLAADASEREERKDGTGPR